MKYSLLISLSEQTTRGHYDKLDKHRFLVNIKIKGIFGAETSESIVLPSCEDVPINSLNMNKLLIVLLAVCLVSTHAFVKRDAPATDINTMIQEAQKVLSEYAAKASSDIQKNLNPEEIKKNIAEFIDNASKKLQEIKPTEAPKQ